MKKIMLLIFFIFVTFLNADNEKTSCPKCSYENEAENRYCLNCSEEIRTLSNDELVQLHKRNQELSNARINSVKNMVEKEAIITKNRKEKEKQRNEVDVNEPLLGKNFDDFPTESQFKKIQEEFITQKKEIVKYYRKKNDKVPFIKTLTPIIVKGTVYYHRSEVSKKGIIPYVSSDKMYFTKEEVIEYHFEKHV